MPPTTEPTQPRLTLWDHAWRTAVMVGISAVMWMLQLFSLAELGPDDQLVTTDRETTLLLLDVAVGTLTYPLVFLRRRFPVTVAIVLNVAAGFSAVASAPALLSVVSVATRRRWREIAPVALVSVVSVVAFELLTNEDPVPWLFLVPFAVLLTAALVAIGTAIGSRRELVASLRQRAEANERAQHAREDQARAEERNRIAREMHDVLAHRISVVTMHAGALAAREDLSPEQVRATARVIEEGSRAALTDLRSVLGVLRDQQGRPAEQEPPQPTLLVLDALVAEAREHGPVELVLPGGGPAGREEVLAGLPQTVSRTAYRVVQEGLTNVRRHAPGAAARVQVTAVPGHQLVVRVENDAPPARPADAQTPPTSGLGLLGVRERAATLGGSVTAGPTEAGGYVLEVRLPWQE